MRRFCARLLTAGAVAGMLSVAGGLPARADAVFTVYVATPADGGSDTKDGRTPQTPVTTLARVQSVIAAARPATDVEVRFKQGLYASVPMVDWHTYVPGHTISFMPIDYQYGEGSGGIAGRPVFFNPLKPDSDTVRHDRAWLTAQTPADAAAPLHGGGTSGLRFYYLELHRYQGGISIDGGTTKQAAPSWPIFGKKGLGLNGNTVFGMVFKLIGSTYTNGHFGYGAMLLTNSSNNTVNNNHFVNVENKGDDGGYIHGVYVTHFSSGNQIHGNRFDHNSGDPVKLRDRSNNNSIEKNHITKSGKNSFYREEFCDTQCAIKNNKNPRECASYDNGFAYNRIISGYKDATIPAWTLNPTGATTTGQAPCTMPDGKVRLHTAGNTTS